MSLNQYRSGTLGLYWAMQILGFKTYHLYECINAGGLAHIKIFKEAITAYYNQLSGIKRYDRADCEKWLADYDVSELDLNAGAA
jgi:hypothetical protein